MISVDQISKDVTVLVARMLHANDELFMFGEDGCGQHGQNSQVFRGHVFCYKIECSISGDTASDIRCILTLHVIGYDSSILGHALTDKNLEICLNQMFAREMYDVDSWDWADISLQGRNSIVLMLDVPKLLAWP